MADTTEHRAYPFPEPTDSNDVPADLQALAAALDVDVHTLFQALANLVHNGLPGRGADDAHPIDAITDLADVLEDLSKATSVLAGYRESVVTLGTSGTQTLDFVEANVWVIDPTGTIDIAYDNLPDSGEAAPGTLIVLNDTQAITWPSGTLHPDGEAPALDGETWLSIVARGSTVTVGRAWGGVA